LLLPQPFMWRDLLLGRLLRPLTSPPSGLINGLLPVPCFFSLVSLDLPHPSLPLFNPQLPYRGPRSLSLSLSLSISPRSRHHSLVSNLIAPLSDPGDPRPSVTSSRRKRSASAFFSPRLHPRLRCLSSSRFPLARLSSRRLDSLARRRLRPETHGAVL